MNRFEGQVIIVTGGFGIGAGPFFTGRRIRDSE
jgi:hypothetical protein